jgi:outer membrane protein OmpA-like peptidoglycan-associated protein
MKLSAVVFPPFLIAAALAQAPQNLALQNNPVQRPAAQESVEQSNAVFRTTVVSRTVKAVNYRHRSGATTIDLGGTALLPNARAEAKVESKQGYIEIEVEFDDIGSPASKFGPEYLTYVMWAVTPEGRATNLGEVILNGTKSKLNVTTELQSFALIVTAEPYFAVSQPSDAVVMENVIRPDTRGRIEEVEARYELLQRGVYTLNVSPGQAPERAPDPRTPLTLLQARNAVDIARYAGADRYAADTFEKARKLLDQAEDYHRRKQTRPTSMVARESVQTAEDARMITVKRVEEERLAKERQAAADRESQAKAETEAEARRRAEAEASQRAEAASRQRAEEERRAAEQARLEADKARQAAQEAAAQAARQQAEAEAAGAAALAQQQAAQAEAEKARLAAEEAGRRAQDAERERAELRERVRQQLNSVLETRDSARGLIVNMPDVLFDFGKAELKPTAREKLARVAGIVLSQPSLKLEAEGHTDSVGSDEFNQKLSEQRAAAVQQYFLQNGITAENVTARGFGEAKPAAPNTTNAGRQQNRRVELVVSGEAIGTPAAASASRR